MIEKMLNMFQLKLSFIGSSCPVDSKPTYVLPKLEYTSIKCNYTVSESLCSPWDVSYGHLATTCPLFLFRCLFIFKKNSAKSIDNHYRILKTDFGDAASLSVDDMPVHLPDGTVQTTQKVSTPTTSTSRMWRNFKKPPATTIGAANETEDNFFIWNPAVRSLLGEQEVQHHNNDVLDNIKSCI